MFGRLGGEEFAICLSEANAASAREVADRISSAFADAGRSLGRPGLKTTVSVGIALSGREPASLDDLLAAADRGLYSAKRLGRNRVEEERFSSSVVQSFAAAGRA